MPFSIIIKIFAAIMFTGFAIGMLFSPLWIVSFYVVNYAGWIILFNGGFRHGIMDELDYEKKNLIALLALVTTGFIYYLDFKFIHLMPVF